MLQIGIRLMSEAPLTGQYAFLQSFFMRLQFADAFADQREIERRYFFKMCQCRERKMMVCGFWQRQTNLLKMTAIGEHVAIRLRSYYPAEKALYRIGAIDFRARKITWSGMLQFFYGDKFSG